MEGYIKVSEGLLSKRVSKSLGIIDEENTKIPGGLLWRLSSDPKG